MTQTERTKMERKYSQWAKDDCDVCGEEFLVTRAMEKIVPDGEKIVCNDCEMWERGWKDAEVQYKKEIKDLRCQFEQIEVKKNDEISRLNSLVAQLHRENVDGKLLTR